MLIYYMQYYSDRWHRWTDYTGPYATEDQALSVLRMYRRGPHGDTKYRVVAVDANFDGPLRGPMAKAI